VTTGALDCLNHRSLIITTEPTPPVDEDPRLRLIVDTLQERKALDVVLIDLRGVSDAADFFILCTGTSEPHVRALSNDVANTLREAGHRPWHVEGTESLRWVLVDFVDIVVHVFRQEARDFYALERLWGDAGMSRFNDSWTDDEAGDDEFKFAPVTDKLLDDD
jgi:ribosome-associated protein